VGRAAVSQWIALKDLAVERCTADLTGAVAALLEASEGGVHTREVGLDRFQTEDVVIGGWTPVVLRPTVLRIAHRRRA
jgi:hypothetical protein